jgi:hypothetical protein
MEKKDRGARGSYLRGQVQEGRWHTGVSREAFVNYVSRNAYFGLKGGYEQNQTWNND